MTPAGARSGGRITTLPNLLGLSRILLTPVVMALVLLPFSGSGLIAALVFAVAAATDFLDGRVARARNQVTSLGVFMDLTADKVLVAGVLIAMVEVHLLPTWIVAVILLRELVIGGIRQLAASASVVIAARFFGKAKTVATLIGMVVLLLAHDGRTGGPISAGAGEALAAVGFWVMVAAAILAMISGFDYLRGALPMLLGNAPPRAEDRPPT